MIKSRPTSSARCLQIGMACGLIVSMLVSPSLARNVASVALVASASGSLQSDPVADDFVELQEEIASEIFGSPTEAGTALHFDDAIDGVGLYAGSNYNDLPVDFDVIWVVDGDVANNDAALHAEGVVAGQAVGTLHGSAGSVQVACAVAHTGTYTPDDGFLVIPHTILSVGQYETFDFASRQQQRLFVDMNTMEATPQVPEIPQGSDVWTLDGGATTMIEGPGGGGNSDQQACIDAAYDQYDIAVQLAQDQAAVCLVHATGVWLACTAGCTIGFAVPLFGHVGATICILTCLGNYAWDMAQCSANLTLALNAAQAALEAALQACGVDVVPY